MPSPSLLQRLKERKLGQEPRYAPATALLLISLTSFPVSAQVAELGFHAGVGKFTGQDFEGTELGFPVGGHLLFCWGDTRFGVGIDQARHGKGGFEDRIRALRVLGIFRYVFPGETHRFFLGAKVGYLEQNTEVWDSDFGVTGTGAGPTFGVQVPLSFLVVELAGEALYGSYEGLSMLEEPIPASDFSGLKWTGTLGVVLPLPG